MADDLEFQQEPPVLLYDAWGKAKLTFADVSWWPCSLYVSDEKGKPRIWFGNEYLSMHLSQSGVKALLPYLQRFVETGKLIAEKEG